MKYFLCSLLVACSLGVVGCSSSDDGDDDDDRSSTGGSSGSSQSSSGSASGGTKSECNEPEDCEALTCTCAGGFSGAEVRRCDNGVCAKTCEEAGCT